MKLFLGEHAFKPISMLATIPLAIPGQIKKNLRNPINEGISRVVILGKTKGSPLFSGSAKRRLKS